MSHLDASAVAANARETHSEAIWTWLGEHAADPILYSGWTVTEVSNALSIKVRTGAYTMEDRVTAWNNWRRFRQDNLAEISVIPDHFETAAHFLDRPDLGLRAGDALHIAIAESGSLRLVTFDTQMADAALQLGVPVERI